jgi:Zn-dependent peptidase ImmA (M78 family)
VYLHRTGTKVQPRIEGDAVNNPVYKIRDKAYGLRVNKEGAPILSADEIEEISEDFLERFDAKSLENPMETNLNRIVQKLSMDYDVKFMYSVDLGLDEDGRKIIGKYTPKGKEIYVDPILLDQKARWKFTLAHEIGHFVLHTNLDALPDSSGDSSRTDNYRTLSLHNVNGKRPKDWIEWQANRFAGAILVPRFTLKEKLISLQESMGIRIRLGQIYLDYQPVNVRDFQKLVFRLQHTYRISSAVIKVRLRHLELIVGKSNTQKSSSVLSEVFAEIKRLHAIRQKPNF